MCAGKICERDKSHLLFLRHRGPDRHSVSLCQISKVQLEISLWKIRPRDDPLLYAKKSVEHPLTSGLWQAFLLNGAPTPKPGRHDH